MRKIIIFCCFAFVLSSYSGLPARAACLCSTNDTYSQPVIKPYLKHGAILCREASYLHNVLMYQNLEINSWLEIIFDYDNNLCEMMPYNIPIQIYEYTGPIKSVRKEMALIKVRVPYDNSYFYTLQKFIDYGYQ